MFNYTSKIHIIAGGKKYLQNISKLLLGSSKRRSPRLFVNPDQTKTKRVRKRAPPQCVPKIDSL